jgi:hypothetical protein
MMDLTGEGVLALWNGIEARRGYEYNAWHTREHVPERLSVPGMCSARRYKRIDGPLPEYLTLYAVEDTSVFSSTAYQSLLANPTDWTRSMRPSFRGFMRVCCNRLCSVGGGLGCAIATIVVDQSVDLASDALRAALDAILGEPPFLAAHVLAQDRSVPKMPFEIGGDAPGFPDAGVLIFESYDDTALSLGLPAIRALLLGMGLAGVADTLTTYSLACALDRGSLDRVVAIGPENLPESWLSRKEA